jgi:CPA2 family monovalent cation:H+ antiporter-2
VFLAGRDGRTAMRVGTGLAQIGEFSFIIASLGITLKVTSGFLYPVIVAVSAITTFLTPYLIKMADPLTTYLARIIPTRISHVFNTYTLWLQSMNSGSEKQMIINAIKKGFLQIFINLILVIGIFIVGSFVVHFTRNGRSLFMDLHIQEAFIWGLSLIISLPFLIAIYRKLNGLSMIFSEITVKPNAAGKYNIKMRRTISAIIPVAFMLGLILMIIALSASILPPLELLILVCVIVVILTAILWRWFVKLHSQLQIAFIETLEKKSDKHDE